jgi:predicted SprT family Zn-dependent metalloprotease
MAQFVLEHLGFKGLRMKSNGGGIIRFSYQSYDERRLNHMMGEPKSDIKAPNIRYPYGVHGLLAVWPGKSEVLLRNTVKQGKTFIEIPDVLKKEAPPDVAPLPKVGNQNDDGNVPVTHIPGNLEADYLRAQEKPKFRVKFMQDIWIYFNHTKFGNKLEHPTLVLMKGVDAAKMRTRGVWYPRLRELRMNPNTFNASQNLFLEIFLHEMCHQAVTEQAVRGDLSAAEIADNRKHKGHGTAWAAWMRKVGLNPLRFDPNENSTYMEEEERNKHEEKMARWRKSADEAKIEGLSLVHSVKPGDVVMYRTMDGLKKGVVAVQMKRSPSVWAIFPWDLVQQSVQSSYTWTNADLRTVYNPHQKENIASSPHFKVYYHALIDRQHREKAAKDEKSKKGLREGDQAVVELSGGRRDVGVLVMQVKKVGNVWAVLPMDQLKELYYQGDTFDYWKIPGDHITVSGQHPNLKDDPQFRRYAEAVAYSEKHGVLP